MGNIVKYSVSGNFKKTLKFLNAAKELRIKEVIEPYAQQACEALAKDTPKRTGVTAASWSYKIDVSDSRITVSWLNSSLADDNKTPIVFLIIYGHGTGTGGYVLPNDFVSPIMEPLCKEMAEAVWKAVTSL